MYTPLDQRNCFSCHVPIGSTLMTNSSIQSPLDVCEIQVRKIIASHADQSSQFGSSGDSHRLLHTPHQLTRSKMITQLLAS